MMSGRADGDRDGKVTIRELSDHVYEQVHKATGGNQSPNINGDYDRELPLAVVK